MRGEETTVNAAEDGIVDAHMGEDNNGAEEGTYVAEGDEGDDVVVHEIHCNITLVFS